MDPQALEIISALRLGVPPEYGVERYSVGRTEIVDVFRSDLARVSQGESALRYISADIGQGKTHLLRLLRHEAYGRDFVVAEVELSSGRCPLYSLLDVYRNIVLALRTRTTPLEPALETVLDRWLDFQKSTTSAMRAASLERLAPDFQAALLSYLSATNFLRPSPQRRDLILRWFLGERLTRSQRDQLELFENINDDTALWMLDDMSDLFRDIGYGGICILFDEAESIVSFSRSSERAQAEANLRRIVDAAEKTAGCYFVYSTTPSFVDSYGTRSEYHARGSDGTVLVPRDLSEADVQLLVDRIVATYVSAHDWAPTSGQFQAIRHSVAGMTATRVSTITRAVVSGLDELRDRS